ncbi:MAG: TadE/TadG family type IV pilus assembly protein [Litorimonas sp.]
MMKFLKPFVKPRTTKQFYKDTCGNVGMMFAVTAFALIGGLAVAIDIANGFSAQARLQNTTDALALLASRDGIEDQAELEAAAQAYFEQAYPNQSGDRIEVVSISRTGDRVDIETRNNIDTFFAPIFGNDDLNVRVKSSSIFSQQSLDIALVLDTTGSMQGAKIATLRNNATELMTTLEGFNNDKLRVSIVPFAQYVNVGANQRGQAWLDTNGVTGNTVCAGSRLAPLNTVVDAGSEPIPATPNATCPTAAIQPLTNDFNALRRTVRSFTASGFTYAPAGLMWGWRTLDARAPFTEASTSGNGQKVLVFMTDGANTRSVSGETHNGRNRDDADDVTAQVCNNIKDSDVTVYTIAFEVSDTTTQNLLRNCASGAGNFFNAQNATDLANAFSNISATLNELRITS